MQRETKDENSTVDRVRLSDENPTEWSDCRNNNHHVVPIGILIVLVTVYLMIAGVRNNYNGYVKPGAVALKLSKPNTNINDKNVHAYRKELGFEEQPLCRKIEVFSKELFTLKKANESTGQPIMSSNLLIKRRKQMKSTKSKSDSARKRDNSKKSNTAEPIIYLFALVFIYLLLKAASDINQHYKTNKGDKRLRRCSLQSYAQKEQRHNHQDRRASKAHNADLPLHTRHNIFTEGRSVSLDRFRQEKVPKELLRSVRHQTSIDDHARTYPFKPIHPAVGKHFTSDALLEPRMSRRLSVPISINYQTVHVSPLAHPEMARRGSVADMVIPGLPPTVPSVLPTLQTPDSKRRVRMINRH
ncbi:uncharacterized protein [Drosophila virilis]|uniref:Uncharacterized protein, isoform B n=1 Tax=Drosophila virilis TaxID=7244 RepID=A0A0Q9WFM1_DROVI|nr:uncharacterized protein LOC6626518 isoform X2 [Drosophila virilis]KRF79248.1 uncharacterized protein Dvir_GJ21053, isoform B [Drosophila virilis]